jgi:AcrR family transcriptional regulator
MDRETAEAALEDRPRHLRPRRRPLQARAHRRREAILAAASALLSQRGAEGASTAAVARRAGVPIGSVYSYFPSKQAILVELASRKLGVVDDAFVARLASALERMPWRQAVADAVEGSVAAFRDDPSYVAVWRAMRSSAEFRAVAAASDERFARALAALPLVAPLPAARRLLRMRASIRIANSFLDWTLEAASPREVAAIVREMEAAIVAYLAPDLDAATRALGRKPRRR